MSIKILCVYVESLSLSSSSLPLLFDKVVLVPQGEEAAPSLQAPRAFCAHISWHHSLHGPGAEVLMVTRQPTADTHRTSLDEACCRTTAMLQYKEDASKDAAALSDGPVSATSPLLGRLMGLAQDVGLQPAQAWLRLTVSSGV